MFNNAYAPNSPPVFCPLVPAFVKPTADLIKDTVAWTERWGFTHGQDAESLSAVGVTFAVSFFSDTPDERLVDLARYSTLAFFWDTMTEGAETQGKLAEVAVFLARNVRIVQVPDSYAPGENPALDAWHETVNHMRTWASPSQMRRFCDTYQTWIFGFVQEAAIREQGYQIDLDSYLRVRAASVGAENAIACGELCYDVEMTDAERDAPAVRAASEAATLTAALDNDRYSRAKADRMDDAPDIFDYIQRARPGCSFAEALVEAVSIRDRCLGFYLHQRERLLPDASPQLREYFRVLDTVVTGNLVFGDTALRYLTPGQSSMERSWVSTPSASPFEPVALSHTAWWWNHLLG